MTIDEARNNLSRYLRIYFPKLTIDDLEISDSRGYWYIKKPCGGREGGCTNMIHTTLFNEGSMQHTISYTDDFRGRNGKFKSIYETWKTIKKTCRTGIR
jgi:hypothetical protein